MTKMGIGYSPLSEKIYLGKQNSKERTWVGEKRDITQDFIAVAFEYFEENTVRDISSGEGATNLFINVKNDKKGLERVIKNLTKRLAALDK